MSVTYLQTRFFLILLIALLTLSFFVLRPYLGPIVLAATFAVIFHPLYLKLRSSLSGENISALLTVFIVSIVLILPAIFFATQLFHEASILYGNVKDPSTDISGRLQYLTKDNLRTFALPISLNFDQLVERALNWVLQQTGGLVTSAMQFLFNVLISLITFFYFLRDGDRIIAKIKSLSPFNDSRDQNIIHRIHAVINAVVKGFLLVALIQGVIAGIGFSIFGVPNAVLWGSMTAIAALVPYLGTAIIITPAVIYLFLIERMLAAAGLILWGIVAVGMIDTFLGPKLINPGIKLHPVAILIAVLGGLTYFGPIGYLLGPLVISLLFSMLEIYPIFLHFAQPRE